MYWLRWILPCLLDVLGSSPHVRAGLVGKDDSALRDQQTHKLSCKLFSLFNVCSWACVCQNAISCSISDSKSSIESPESFHSDVEVEASCENRLSLPEAQELKSYQAFFQVFLDISWYWLHFRTTSCLWLHLIALLVKSSDNFQTCVLVNACHSANLIPSPFNVGEIWNWTIAKVNDCHSLIDRVSPLDSLQFKLLDLLYSLQLLTLEKFLDLRFWTVAKAWRVLNGSRLVCHYNLFVII